MKNFISNLHHRHHPLQFSLIILCTLIFFSLLIGIIFYKYQNEWRWSTSIFYAINTLVGILYDVPQSKTNIADVFTLLFYIYGTFFLAGIIGAIVGTAIFHASLITSLEMRHLLNIPSNLNFNEKETSQSTRMESTDHRKKLLNFIPLMTTLIWLGIGGIFGVVFEGKSFGSSLYFALSTMSAACYASLSLFIPILRFFRSEM